MKAPQQLGLVVEGNSTKSAILRFPDLGERIGPIKASSLSVAHRVSNFLRAGSAVATYDELEGCDLVLIRVPDQSVERVVNEIAGSKLDLRGVCFLLCETWLPSDALRPLESKGSLTATLLAIPAEDAQWFAVEGAYAAVKRVKRMLNTVGARVLELKSGTKQLYFAASAFAETLPRALFAAAQQSLRASGLSGNHLYAVIEEMAQSMFRDISRGSRAGWTGPLLDCPEDLAATYMQILRDTRPDLAGLLTEHLKLAEPFIKSRIERRNKIARRI
jgi:predicted short-subunit dehydrogenase-like oxidoreductase (DUF2520 family)